MYMNNLEIKERYSGSYCHDVILLEANKSGYRHLPWILLIRPTADQRAPV